jgi:hypothetical protein
MPDHCRLGSPMKSIVFFVLLIVFSTPCLAQESIQERQSRLLRSNFKETPYSAWVKIQDVKKKGNELLYPTYLLTCDVFETFKGEPLDRIAFLRGVEDGYKTLPIGDETIVSLFINEKNGQYYLGDNGYDLPANQHLLEIARELAADGKEVKNKEKRPLISTNLSLEQTERSDMDDSDASMGFKEFSAEVEWQFLLFTMDHREYDWHEGAGLGTDPGHDPWENLTRISPGLQYYRELSQKWGVWAKLVTIGGFEDEISSGSWTFNPQVLAFHMLTEHITLYGGLGLLYHPVDSQFYPVMGVAWSKDSKDGFSGALGFPETMLRYGLNERIGLKTDFEWDIRTYSLAEKNDLAPDGFVYIEDLILGLYLEYLPVKDLTLRLGIRRYFGREMTIYDQDENKMTSPDVDPSWSYLFGINYDF